MRYREHIRQQPGVPANVEAPHRRVDDPAVAERLNELIEMIGGDPDTFEAELLRQLISASLRLLADGHDTGEIKLITAAVKELRYAYSVFARYAEPRKVTIFGSARTAEDHPDFAMCVEFSRLIAEAGWMAITGAGNGIMKAGHTGPGRTNSFGVAIRLPFETTANDIIKGDEKLIHFRYFFTRKLMFVSQADAVVLFPGGFGTMDEAFETITLVQTGKASPVPIVMLEGASGGRYWQSWRQCIRENLLGRGMIDPEDIDLFHIASTPEEAVEHLVRFYRIYHSSRYVKDDLVLRLNARLRDEDVDRLNDEFAVLVKKGRMVQRSAYEVEDDELDKPRLAFTHTRHHYGLVRKLIDAINGCEPADASTT